MAQPLGRQAAHGRLWPASAVAVLSHAVDPLGKIASNPCEGIKQLYSGDRSEIIWTDADIAELKATCCARDRLRVDLAVAHRPTPRRPSAPVLVAHRRGRDRPHHGQEQASARGNHSAIRCSAQRAGEHPQAVANGSDQPAAPPLDSERLRDRIQPSQDRRRHDRPRSALSRSARHRCDTVLRRGTARARDR